MLLDEVAEAALVEQLELAAAPVDDIDPCSDIAHQIVGRRRDAERPDAGGRAGEARPHHKVGIVKESGAAPQVRTHQGAARRGELSAELERRRGRQHRLVIAAHVKACAARALLVDIVEADMGGVEIDHAAWHTSCHW